MAFSFFEYLLSFQRYSSFFVFKNIDGVTNGFSVKINSKIKNISGNIRVTDVERSTPTKVTEAKWIGYDAVTLFRHGVTISYVKIKLS